MRGLGAARGASREATKPDGASWAAWRAEGVQDGREGSQENVLVCKEKK